MLEAGWFGFGIGLGYVLVDSIRWLVPRLRVRARLIGVEVSSRSDGRRSVSVLDSRGYLDLTSPEEVDDLVDLLRAARDDAWRG